MLRIVTRRFMWTNETTTVRALHRRFCTELQPEESIPEPKEPATEAKGKVVSEESEDSPNNNYSGSTFRPRRPVSNWLIQEGDRDEYMAQRPLGMESPSTLAAIRKNGPFQALLNPKITKNGICPFLRQLATRSVRS